MRYFYSGAPAAGADQFDPEHSLGGFISDTPIPNDLLENIFTPASYLSIQQSKRETKLIVLQNDDKTRTASGLSMDFALNADTLAKYQIAFVEPDADNDCFEELTNSAALPFSAVFNPIAPGSPMTLPDMAPGAYLGVWLQRNYDFTTLDLQPQNDAYWKAQLTNPTTPGIKDNLDLILTYTLS